MASHNYIYRYEIKPSRYVYTQATASKVSGNLIIRQVLRRYSPHQIFYHLHRRGGHVAALRLHQRSAFFSRFDIVNFFGQVTRTRVARSLREIGFNHKRAFSIAWDSVVDEGGHKVLPYGFRQSPLLATLALEHSNLGSALKNISNSGVNVSVYMDDILISSNNKSEIEAHSSSILDAAEASQFPLSKEKIAIATPYVQSFNCHIESSDITIIGDRMDKFVEDYRTKTANGQMAVEKYISAISASEHSRFVKLI